LLLLALALALALALRQRRCAGNDTHTLLGNVVLGVENA
jgi:hypothetical protein